MSEKLTYIMVYVVSVLIASVSQIFLKKSADLHYDKWWQEYLNPKVIFAYGLFFLAALLNTLALRAVDVSMGMAIESIGYFMVAVLSVIFLKEKMTPRKIGGMLLVIGGILLYNI